jgi:hypothetical protein
VSAWDRPGGTGLWNDSTGAGSVCKPSNFSNSRARQINSANRSAKNRDMRVIDAARYLGTPLLSLYLRKDYFDACEIRKSYLIGNRALANFPSLENWRALERKLPGFKLRHWSSEAVRPLTFSPFIYESPDAPHLIELRRQFNLENIVGRTSDEY